MDSLSLATRDGIGENVPSKPGGWPSPTRECSILSYEKPLSFISTNHQKGINESLHTMQLTSIVSAREVSNSFMISVYPNSAVMPKGDRNSNAKALYRLYTPCQYATIHGTENRTENRHIEVHRAHLDSHPLGGPPESW